MSHISKIELKIKDLEALKMACKRLNLKFRKNQKTYKWYGRFVGDTVLPEGVREEELGACDHAIHVPGADYGIGVLQRGKENILLWDSWIKGGLEKKLGKDAGKLKQIYAIEKIKLEARKRGLKIREKVTPKKVRLILSV